MTAILGIDTATEDTAVAVIDGGRILWDQVRGPESGRPLHGPALLGMVEEAVAEAGGWRTVSKITVGIGPGSFTGLRVGLATAKALARTTGLPVGGVCTLDSLAALTLERHDQAGPILTALDARRGQIFAALYRSCSGGAPNPRPHRLIEPFVCEPEQLAERLGGHVPVLATGSGSLRFKDQLEAAGTTVPGSEDLAHRVSARWTAKLGEVAGEPAEPIYLRPPDAERWRKRDRSTRNP